MDFACSDLAAECIVREGDGVRIRRCDVEGCEITHVRIDSPQAAARIGKPQGRYVTVECGAICALDECAGERAARILSVEIRDMALRMCARRTVHELSLLVVGLGNAEMTPDALGAKTAKILPVNRCFRGWRAEGLGANASCLMAAICPGVTAQTGIETAELVRCVTAQLQPDLVIAVDALAARSVARLGATVQISDSGIQPGAGVGNARQALTDDSIGVPVMALGVPTVINCATLAADALGGAVENVRMGAEGMRGFFLCPKEIDLLAGRSAMLLARAIEKAFFD